MNELLRRYAERIDAATLRERVMIFVAATLVLVVAAYVLLLEPLRARQQRLSAETAQAEQALKAVQTELRRLAQSASADPDAENRRRRDALLAELGALNARIAEESRRFTAPDRMRDLLAEILERNQALTLVSMRNLEAVPLQQTQAGGGAAQAGGGPQGLFRHGIELTVQGRYLDLYAYLRALERTQTQIYWGRAELTVVQYPVATLKLTVYTVSFDRAWLVV